MPKESAAKLGRFFRDDDEMGAATDLGASLRGAIEDSESLIVLCSPAAAQSKWVNTEILHFKRTGRADRIFAVIASGTPHASESGDYQRECFPPALRFEVDAAGELTQTRAASMTCCHGLTSNPQPSWPETTAYGLPAVRIDKRRSIYRARGDSSWGKMISYFRGISLALTALALAGCGTAGDAAFIPLREMLYAPPPDRMLLVVETTSNLPRRSENDTTGVFFTQVDLAANHAVMVGFNEAYIAGYDLRHGDLIGRQLVGPHAPYQMFSGPGPDYALTFYSRNDGVWLENVCHFENAIVYRLRPGVINYIPKDLQPPLYNGRRQGGALLQPDTAELRRVLSRFPVSSMEIVVPEVVAIVRFDPDRLDRVISANDCSYNNRFTILERYDVGG